LAITADGVFYMNQTWVNFLCFEKNVGDKYQKEFPNSQLQIQCTETNFFSTKNPNLNPRYSGEVKDTKKKFINFVESKDFKAKLYENNLLVLEGCSSILMIKVTMSK